LSNYARRLSENGRSEEALGSAKQALDIREHLAKAKPERFEPDWATSLNNYANRLSENGRSEEALTALSSASQIYGRWAERLPLKFGADYRISVLYQCFLIWLCGKDEWKQLLAARPDPLAIQYSTRESAKVAFLDDFVHACLANTGTPAQLKYADDAQRKWHQLDAGMQYGFEDSFFIVAALVDKASPELSEVSPRPAWRARYAAMVKRRHGHLPIWLQTAMTLLRLELPPV
ncbi:MAG: tetratricopeptide repeat protein, partial [Prosthecobacter sp.]|nr:tetratricopeptide repeat protein [Prosthecobacter sp.]